MVDENYSNNRPLVCDWLLWIGQPMLYDGALCVERDYDPSIKIKPVVSLDMRHRIISQWDPS